MTLCRAPIVSTVAFLALTVPGAARQDPFLPAWRWEHVTPSGAGWIPGALAVAGCDNLVWGVLEGPSGGLVCLALDGGPDDRSRGRDERTAAAVGAIRVAAARGAGPAFSLAQYPAPDLARRRTEVVAYEGFGSGVERLAPRWVHDPGVRANGPALLACDGSGEVVVVALHDPGRGHVLLEWLDPGTGAARSRVACPATSLGELAVAGDGGLVALAAGTALWLYDASGRLLGSHDLGAAPRGLSVADDGRVVLTAIGGAIVRFARSGTGWSEARAGGPGSVACLVLSADGRSIAAGRWDPADPGAATFEVLDGEILEQLVSVHQTGSPGDPQNLPRAACASADGRRVAFGSWGNGRDPQVLLVDREPGGSVRGLDLPGSVRGLALDRGGTRVVVGHKDGHANQFGSRGAVRLFDTGERALQALSPAEPGSALALVARSSDADTAFFLLGEPALAPGELPGALGELWLRPPLRAHAAPVDDQGRADWSGILAGDRTAAGRVLGAQVAFRQGGRTLLVQERLEILVLPAR